MKQNIKPNFSISQIGATHFWMSGLIGTVSSVLFTLFLNSFVKFFVLIYWMDEVGDFLARQDTGSMMRDLYTGEILVTTDFNSPELIFFHQSFAFVSVALGLSLTARLFLFNKTSKSIRMRVKRDWNVMILYNHLWSTLHFFTKCFFAISLWPALTIYVDLQQLVLIHILVFVYFYFLSIHALMSHFRLKRWTFLIFLYCLVLIWGIGQFCRPNYKNFPEAFEKYKIELQDYRIEELEKYDEEIPDNPPPPPPEDRR